MRITVESILGSKGQDFFDLPLSARLLLITDGTVTELLEALVGEPLKIGWRNQVRTGLKNHPDAQEMHNISECLERAIALQGESTSVRWLYAESVIYHQLLPPEAQEMLVEDKIPIGTVLREQTSDNHRKIVDCGHETNRRAADILGLESDYNFLYRNYDVHVGPNRIMNITEWFPISRIEGKLSGT